MQHVDYYKLLLTLGVSLELDWDGELLYRVPDNLDADRLREFIFDHRSGIALTLAHRMHSERRVYCGGPFNGQKHGRLGLCGCSSIVIKIKPREWVAYRPIDKHGLDGRIVYVGQATSEKKAKALAWESYKKAFLNAGEA